MRKKQDLFLEFFIKTQEPVALYLKNGVKLLGRIEASDKRVVLLKDTLTQIIYKHAIATVSSAKASSINSRLEKNY